VKGTNYETAHYAVCSLPSYQPKAGLEMNKSQTLKTDDVLMCTPQGAMTDEYGAMME
jgi:hypothetical protein